MVCCAESATALGVVGVVSCVYQFTPCSWIVVCDGGPGVAAGVGADGVAGEDLVSEGSVASAAVDLVVLPPGTCLPGVGGASSAWPVEEFRATWDVADFHRS